VSSVLVGGAAVLLAAGLTAISVEPLRRLALRLGLTDRPGPTKAHTRPTAYLGGLGIVLGTVGAAAAVGAWTGWSWRATVVLGAAVAVAGLGLVDDIAPLRPSTRLLVESVVAAAVVAAGYRLPLTGSLWLDSALTVACVVVLTNSFNLLDNMDAAAASIAAASAGVLGAAALWYGAGTPAILLLGLAGSCLGFLVHNRPPARIFMGDAGSLFIGFLVVTCTASVAPRGGGPAAAVLLLATFVAVVDTTLVVMSRHRAGRPVFSGGTDHVSHRLHRLGLSTGLVAAVLALAAGAAAVLAALVLADPGRAPLALGLALVIAVGAVGGLLGLPATPAASPSHTAPATGPRRSRRSWT
jgi:UDP-GlcNAc:undecaprenyl-phosphate/decaprenyl-phosphate GlcNAc-1-phosphate transferase